jgi:hypothetical protein
MSSELMNSWIKYFRIEIVGFLHAIFFPNKDIVSVHYLSFNIFVTKKQTQLLLRSSLVEISSVMNLSLNSLSTFQIKRLSRKPENETDLLVPII